VVEHCHAEVGHTHVRQSSQGCRGEAPRKSWYAPSAIMSFASLDTCISLLDYEYFEQLSQLGHLQNPTRIHIIKLETYSNLNLL
jgi:hypothetical protein